MSKPKRMLIHEVRLVDYYECQNCHDAEFTKTFNCCPKCLTRIEWVRLKK